MDALFESQFSPLAYSGHVLSKCGKCLRYMKHITAVSPRLFCSTCEEAYYLPHKGTVKLYKELTCPLDNFELVIYSIPGAEGKSFTLCPYCYNSPPFEGLDTLFGASKTPNGPANTKTGSGMPCSLCPHPTCQHSVRNQGVCACPECEGALVLDPVSFRNWKLNCTCVVASLCFHKELIAAPALVRLEIDLKRKLLLFKTEPLCIKDVFYVMSYFSHSSK